MHWESVHFRKTNKNTVVKRVREVYLRDDIPCLSSLCPLSPSCKDRVKIDSSLLSSNATHYLLPDSSVVLRYSELLEQEELTDIILTETVLQRLQQEDRQRTYKSLRQVAKDSRRRTVVFSSEKCSATAVLRRPGESIDEHDWRTLAKTAEWYQAHLSHKVPTIILSEEFSQLDLTGRVQDDTGITVMTLKQYLNSYWQQTPVLHDLLDSLKEAILEEDEMMTQQQQQRHTSQSLPGAKKPSNTTGYTDYKPLSELEAGVKSERFFQGVLKVRPNHRDQAFIRGDSRIGEIVIVGREHRNRAVHGDIVVVELLNKSHWVVPSTHISYDPDETHAVAAEEEEEQQLVASTTLSSTSSSSSPSTRQVKPTGRVVGIVTRNWRSYVATLQEGAENESGAFHLVLPLDPVIPKIRIRHQSPKALAHQRIVVRIDSWPVDSQYPNGHFVRRLGPAHDLDTEVTAILIEHGISVSQSALSFSEGALKEMPVHTPSQPWGPDPVELRQRRDLRNEVVFSIDPPNCQDIDDAISIKEVTVSGKKGCIELGVHIADVSFFVTENGLTDLEARARGTTVYLSDRRFDMLPKVLSEQVCSLRHHVDRYAMSVIWTLDAEANVLSTWYGRTVIRSTCEMEYEQAQGLLDGKSVVPGLDAQLCKKLKKHVVLLAETMRKIRAKRMAKGGLELESSEVKFKFQEEENSIKDIVPKQPLEVHQIIEEAMVMANSYVAQRIYQGFHDSAVLRHHPAPVQSHFRMLLKAAESRGLSIDTSSNLALANSLRDCTLKCGDDIEFLRLLKTMATMAMSEASYISAGAYPVHDYAHYGLALDFYTHFTSPIRRYADLLVHRQLWACLSQPSSPSSLASSKQSGGVGGSEGMDLDGPSSSSSSSSSALLKNGAKVAQICDHLNYKNRESKFAQKDSTELFQTLYVLQKTTGHRNSGRGGRGRLTSGREDGRMEVDSGEYAPAENGEEEEEEVEIPLVETGLISEIRENGFFVFVPRFGIKGPVYLRDKEGRVAIPASVMQNSSGHFAGEEGRYDSSMLEGCTMETDQLTQTTVYIPGHHKKLEFRLFDKVRVGLHLKKSLAHRHSIYMTLIGLESTTTSKNVGAQHAKQGRQAQVEKDMAMARLSNQELVRDIRQGQEVAAAAAAAVKQKKRGKDKNTALSFEQSKPGQSLHDVLEPFERSRIIESSL
ncbi:DIS3 mitotic control [Actinomortierella ambigua]|uniref:DIS3-like exonuclease 1 n=1 Tax=Actinomortierella ambigua TaxID=1343610 RepID=A0A9P6QJ10_9FUNG|nr:DIS3 mitotic control [Actinomortierella ambigua]